MKFIVVLACLAVAAFAAPTAVTGSATISFSGNVTLTNSTQTSTLAYRAVTADAFSFGDINFFFSSAAQVTKAPNQVTLDEVATSFFTSRSVYPEGFVAWFDATDVWTNPSGAQNPLLALAGLSGYGGLIGNAFVNVTEYDTNGKAVNVVDFSKLNFNQAGGLLVDSTGNVKYTWIAATSGSATYNFTVLHSSVLGKLSYGGIVSPKASSIIVEIDNYQYANSTNYLNLTFVSAYGYSGFNGSALASGINSLVAGAGANQIWVSTSTSASINGNIQSVSVSVNATLSSNIPYVISNILKTTGPLLQAGFPGATLGAAVVTVQFAAGASQIIYDPTTGFEQPQGSGAALRSSALAVVIASFIAFLGSQL